MNQRSRWRAELVYEMSELSAKATTLRDALFEPELKRQMTNITVDLGMFDNLIRDRDDLLALLVAQKAEEINVAKIILDAYPPDGPRLGGRQPTSDLP